MPFDPFAAVYLLTLGFLCLKLFSLLCHIIAGVWGWEKSSKNNVAFQTQRGDLISKSWFGCARLACNLSHLAFGAGWRQKVLPLMEDVFMSDSEFMWNITGNSVSGQINGVLRPLGIQRWWRCVCCLSLPFKNALFVQCYCYTEVKQTVLRSLQWCPFTGLPSLGVDVLDMGLRCLQAAQCFPLCTHLIRVSCVWARGFRYKHQSKSGFLLGTSEINSKGFGAALTVFL